MLRKILSLLFILALLPVAIAEEPDANPFIGSWEPLYYIQDGRALTEEENTENPVMFTFTEDSIEMLFPDESTESTAYVRDGAVCTVGSLTYTLEHEDLIVGVEPAIPLSFLLVRIDPIVLNNPFIGTWEVLCVADSGYVTYRPSPEEHMTAIFAADSVQLVSKDESSYLSCTYADGECTLYMDGKAYARCIISEDGSLHIISPENEQKLVICAREDEEVPAEISRFFGTWTNVADITSDGLYTNQMPNALTFCYEFSRAYMQQYFPEVFDIDMPPQLYTYIDGACVVPGASGDTSFTIDSNGLMTARFADGTTSWCIRVEEESSAPQPAE